MSQRTLGRRTSRCCRSRSLGDHSEIIVEGTATIEVILADASGWPSGSWDPTIKMLKAKIAVLMMTDAELRELSGRYMITDRMGTSIKELMTEDARRSRLNAHERLAEAKARQRLQEAR
jgi:hypothetical protein